MRISKSEQAAIKSAVYLGNQVGFGNLLSHLASAWAEMLMCVHGWDEQHALDFAGSRPGYAVAMHRDIVDNGEWDETGKKYQKPKPATRAKKRKKQA